MVSVLEQILGVFTYVHFFRFDDFSFPFDFGSKLLVVSGYLALDEILCADFVEGGAVNETS
ncbi:MAG TPA: hypothetical protein VNF51_00180 [Candidatus Paceibacterota bacterium]|nr:hypothetical protein [Candidatus Paceibacterota bacterium]